jgi:hypothetical protein
MYGKVTFHDIKLITYLMFYAYSDLNPDNVRIGMYNVQKERAR